MVRIENADIQDLLPQIRELFVQYSESLGVDLCFQGFAQELANLPGDYARPEGRLLLAYDDDQAIGCELCERSNVACAR